jgi:hypothetical protein
MTKLTELAGSRCAEMTSVTGAGTPAPAAAPAQGGAQQMSASTARFTAFSSHALGPITFLN